MSDGKVYFVDGCPGYGPCAACGWHEELRMGVCFDCASEAEDRALKRSVLQHLAHGFARMLRGRFDFTTRTCFAWAWERLTRTGDYRHRK